MQRATTCCTHSYTLDLRSNSALARGMTVQTTRDITGHFCPRMSQPDMILIVYNPLCSPGNPARRISAREPWTSLTDRPAWRCGGEGPVCADGGRRYSIRGATMGAPASGRTVNDRPRPCASRSNENIDGLSRVKNVLRPAGKSRRGSPSPSPSRRTSPFQDTMKVRVSP